MKKKKTFKINLQNKNENVIHISLQDLTLRNEMHFHVQKSTRSNIFRDRTKYNRKRKHKNIDY